MKAVPQLPEWTPHVRVRGHRLQTPRGIAKLNHQPAGGAQRLRPTTVSELARAFEMARDDPEVGVIILTEEGTKAFCSGATSGSGRDGYQDAHGVAGSTCSTSRSDPTAAQAGHRHGRRVRDRRRPRPPPVCDLTVAADNAVFGQTGPPGRLLRRRLWRGAAAQTVGLKRPSRCGSSASATTPPPPSLGLVNGGAGG